MKVIRPSTWSMMACTAGRAEGTVHAAWLNCRELLACGRTINLAAGTGLPPAADVGKNERMCFTGRADSMHLQQQPSRGTRQRAPAAGFLPPCRWQSSRLSRPAPPAALPAPPRKCCYTCGSIRVGWVPGLLGVHQFIAMQALPHRCCYTCGEERTSAAPTQHASAGAAAAHCMQGSAATPALFSGPARQGGMRREAKPLTACWPPPGCAR